MRVNACLQARGLARGTATRNCATSGQQSNFDALILVLRLEPNDTNNPSFVFSWSGKLLWVLQTWTRRQLRTWPTLLVLKRFSFETEQLVYKHSDTTCQKRVSCSLRNASGFRFRQCSCCQIVSKVCRCWQGRGRTRCGNGFQKPVFFRSWPEAEIGVILQRLTSIRASLEPCWPSTSAWKECTRWPQLFLICSCLVSPGII